MSFSPETCWKMSRLLIKTSGSVCRHARRCPDFSSKCTIRFSNKNMLRCWKTYCGLRFLVLSLRTRLEVVLTSRQYPAVSSEHAAQCVLMVDAVVSVALDSNSLWLNRTDVCFENNVDYKKRRRDHLSWGSAASLINCVHLFVWAVQVLEDHPGRLPVYLTSLTYFFRQSRSVSGGDEERWGCARKVL